MTPYDKIRAALKQADALIPDFSYLRTNGGCACTKSRDDFRLRQHMQRLSMITKELAKGIKQ